MKIKGVKDTINAFKRYGDEGLALLSAETQSAANEMTAKAKKYAPKDQGGLAQEIQPQTIDELNYRVVSGADYSGYVEFGTGKRVAIPAEFTSLASKWKGKGKGNFKDGLGSIRRWCKLHGIDEDAAYPIFMSILDKGLRARPFMYPAFVEIRAKYPKDLERALKALNKKFNG